MDKFQVIDGIKEENVTPFRLYEKMFRDAANEVLNKAITQGEIDKEAIKQVVFNGIRMFHNVNTNFEVYEYEVLMQVHGLACLTKEMLGYLTPREFLALLPKITESSEHQNQTKDCFSARIFMNQLDMDKPLENKVDEFLWHFRNHNKEIREFERTILALMSAVMEAEEQKG